MTITISEQPLSAPQTHWYRLSAHAQGMAELLVLLRQKSDSLAQACTKALGHKGRQGCLEG